jgi:glycosyltransferase involved in cell wall biosynthesis
VRDPRERPSPWARWTEPHFLKAPISAFRRRHYPAFPGFRRLFGRIAPPRIAGVFNHRLDHLYDAWVARNVKSVSPDVVVCYENAALRTFRIAKALGAVCVLDAAAVHYEVAEQWRPRDPEWVNSQKKDEIGLADVVLTCSDFAAASYRAAGVPASKVLAIPLGTDLPRGSDNSKRLEGPCRFLFVGTVRRLKAVDILLEVFDALARNRTPATLTLIGGVAERDLQQRARTMPNVTFMPFIRHPDLFTEIARHDVLVLPSRLDSFGMVVAEAMAVGVPALVSDRVGAKCIIEAHPNAGWVVACERDALFDKIVELIDDPGRIVAASVAAREAAKDFSWEKYRARVVTTLERIYARYRVLT